MMITHVYIKCTAWIKKKSPVLDIKKSGFFPGYTTNYFRFPRVSSEVLISHT